jgi:hypothetical protein
MAKEWQDLRADFGWPKRQFAYRWDYEEGVEIRIPLPFREDGHEHLSECLLFSDPDQYCTCLDWSPEV